MPARISRGFATAPVSVLLRVELAARLGHVRAARRSARARSVQRSRRSAHANPPVDDPVIYAVDKRLPTILPSRPPLPPRRILFILLPFRPTARLAHLRFCYSYFCRPQFDGPMISYYDLNLSWVFYKIRA